MNEVQTIVLVLIGVVLALVILGGLQRQKSAREQRYTPEERAFLNPQHSDAAFEQTMPFDVVEAIKNGRTLEAIKLYRTQFNCDLKEAKEAIERLQSTLK